MPEVFTGTAGVPVAAGEVVAFDPATEKFDLIHNVADPVLRGVALDDAAADEQFNYLYSGPGTFVAPTGGTTYGQKVGVSATTSELTPGTKGLYWIGIVISPDAVAGDSFVLDVRDTFIVV